MDENNNPDFIWFTDPIKLLNEQLWFPDNVIANDNIRYPFANHNIPQPPNSFKIKFESFKNNGIPTNDLLTNKIKKVEQVARIDAIKKYERDRLNKQYDAQHATIKKQTAFFKKTSTFDNYIKYNFFDFEKGIPKRISYKSVENLYKHHQRLGAINKAGSKYLDATGTFHDYMKNYNKPKADTEMETFDNIENAKLYAIDDRIDKNISMVGKSIHTFRSKVKFSIHQKLILQKWFVYATDVYNACVDCHNNNDPDFPSNYVSAKTYIYERLYKGALPAPWDILTCEIKTFFENLSSCYSNLQNKNIKKFVMKHKDTKRHQTITIVKKCIGMNGIYPRNLANTPNFHKTINVNNFECDCKLTFEKSSGNYYLYIPQYINDTQIANRKKVCAIDPGEKIFASYFSLEEFGQIGDDMRIPLLNIKDRIIKYQKLIGKKNKKGTKNVKASHIRKKINKMFKKIKGMVNELHKKTALYLCRNFDTILIPKFETQQMVCDKVASTQKVKENNDKIKAANNNDPAKLKIELTKYKRKRRLNRNVKFVLNHLAHYKFKQHLFSKAKEYGCKCLEVTEEFTSQLCANCGRLSKSYNNRMKVCTYCQKAINRDVNGSRNILLKNMELLF